jgi:hypothetical protein
MYLLLAATLMSVALMDGARAQQVRKYYLDAVDGNGAVIRSVDTDLVETWYFGDGHTAVFTMKGGNRLEIPGVKHIRPDVRLENSPANEPPVFSFQTENVIISLMGNPYYRLFENNATFSDIYSYRETNPKNFLGLVHTTVYPDADANTALSLDIAYRGRGEEEGQYLIARELEIVNPQPGSDGVTRGYYARGRYLINTRDSAENDPSAYLWDGRWPRLLFTDAIHANNALYILAGVNLAAEDALLAVNGQAVVDVSKLDGLAEAGKIHRVALDKVRPENCTFVFQWLEEGSTDCFIASGEYGWIRIQNGVPVIYNSLSTEGAEIFSISPY